MRFISFRDKSNLGLAVKAQDGTYRGWRDGEDGYPGCLERIIEDGAEALSAAGAALAKGPVVDTASVNLLPPLCRPPKIICVGLNYADHTAESNYDQPDYPALFARFNSSLVGHDAPIVRPQSSDTLDYEGELVAIIGRGGRHIAEASALEYVAGYSLFNDGSVREYQFKAPQWTIGKNFDGTGGFGPELVTADELPAGACGLKLETRLNGEIVQSASTSAMIFDVASLISIVSEALTLEPGDVIVTGTPAGVGFSRDPKLFMKSGDICEVEIEGIGVLRNPIVDEPLAAG